MPIAIPTRLIMARKKSDEIRSTDGRKHNKRLPKKVQINPAVTSHPPRMNEAKKQQIPKYAEKVANKVFGGIEGTLEELANQAKEGNLNALKLFLEYAVGKPDDYHKDVAPPAQKAPVINFINNAPQQEDKVIDITPEEDDADTTES